jgi:hypothetical protein
MSEACVRGARCTREASARSAWAACTCASTSLHVIKVYLLTNRESFSEPVIECTLRLHVCLNKLVSLGHAARPRLILRRQ